MSDHVQQYRREEVVELARLCVNPDHRWATRVVLRLWREVAAPRWKCWPIRAAVAYSQTRRHEGDIYRFDGWTLMADGVGSSGEGGRVLEPQAVRYRRSPRQKAAMGLGLRKGRPVTWVYIPSCRSFPTTGAPHDFIVGFVKWANVNIWGPVDMVQLSAPEEE